MSSSCRSNCQLLPSALQMENALNVVVIVLCRFFLGDIMLVMAV